MPDLNIFFFYNEARTFQEVVTFSTQISMTIQDKNEIAGILGHSRSCGYPEPNVCKYGTPPPQVHIVQDIRKYNTNIYWQLSTHYMRRNTFNKIIYPGDIYYIVP